MNDYFDDVEHQLRAAVPRAARAHRRHLGIVHAPLFRLSALLIAIALPLAVVLLLVSALGGGSARVAPRTQLHPPAATGRHRTDHKRTPRQPNPVAALKALVALRRREPVALTQLRTIGAALRTARPVAVSSLLSFAAATTSFGVQCAIVSSRRPRAHPPDQPAAAAVASISGTRPLPCAVHVHQPSGATPACSARRHGSSSTSDASTGRVRAPRARFTRVAA